MISESGATALDRAYAMGKDHGRSATSVKEAATNEDILSQFPSSGFDEDDILSNYDHGFFDGYCDPDLES